MNEHELENELNIFIFTVEKKDATTNQQRTFLPEKIFKTFAKLFTLYIVHILHLI